MGNKVSKELSASERDKLTEIRTIAETIAGEINTWLQFTWKKYFNNDDDCIRWMDQEITNMSDLLKEFDQSYHHYSGASALKSKD